LCYVMSTIVFLFFLFDTALSSFEKTS
jgi:hypothetical protein